MKFWISNHRRSGGSGAGVAGAAADWASNGSGVVQGAVLAEGNLAGASAPAILFDAPVVNRVRLTYGPMIRVPGGWRDF